MLSNLDQSETGGSQTPTTPRPTRAEPVIKGEMTEVTTASTPTRDNFGGVSGQRPLPEEPFTPQREQHRSHESEGSIKRPVSQRATASPAVQDVEMGDPDEDDGAGEDDGSDNDSVTSDSQRPSKKKKGQRFFCTEYPPCQLNFTRSEHLARHIRKHTGERPFQCHCSRRFSRLDNLRQHAQTVHVNEDIPGDSLAATSTRFQRQIRTERVRPPTARSRASTIGSQGAHSRGHSRTLSASSVGSTTSSIGGPEDLRRRPQPIAMANDPSARARLSLNTFDVSGTGGSAHQYGQYSQSPSGYSTPTSTSFSTGPGSPSGMASPSSTISRSSYYNGSRHARRLSVPSGPRPFQFPMAPSYSASHFEPIPSGTSVTFSPGSGSLVSSPTSSIFHGRRDSETELEYRRRTWHPGTNNNYSQRPATSGLMYHQTIDDQRPATSNQPAASQMNSSQVKLPGIESFDHAPPTPARGSPMLVDAQPSNPGRPSDGGLHQNLTRLDITAANAPIENQWQALRPSGSAQHSIYNQQQPSVPTSYTSHPPAEQPVTPRKNKRQGFYGGIPQPSAQSYLLPRTSPEDSGSSDGAPTPSTFQSAEYNPVIVSHNGAPDPLPPSTVLPDDQKVYYASSYNKPEPARADSGFQPYAQPPQHTYALLSGHDPRYPTNGEPPQNTDMSKLEALVAVATREDHASRQ